MSKRCMHCGISVLDKDTEVCPLCGGALSEQASDDWVMYNGYPDIVAKRRKTTFFLRLLLSVCAGGSVVAAAINIINGGFPWSVIVVASLMYIYIEFSMFFTPDVGIIAKISITILLAALFVVVIDVTCGFGKWSLNYCLPAALIIFNIFIIILMFVNHRRWESYMILIVLPILLGILPLVFMHYALVTHPLLSEVAFISSTLLFLVALIMGGANARMELKRRFHF